LSISSTVERVEFGLEVLAKVDETLKSTKFEVDKVDSTGMTKRQREYALMQQLLAIKQELDSIAGSEAIRSASKGDRKRVNVAGGEEEDGEGDELTELGRKIQEKSFSEEARKVASREFKRLKKSPPQGAEYGVIRELQSIVISRYRYRWLTILPSAVW
jgi:ATP-dependent Lon protease